MPDERQDAIEAVAAEWVSRLSGEPLRPDERRALDGWLAEHPDHRATFDYARATWAELGVLRAAPGSLACDFVPPRARKGGPPRRRRTGLLRGAGALRTSTRTSPASIAARWSASQTHSRTRRRATRQRPPSGASSSALRSRPAPSAARSMPPCTATSAQSWNGPQASTGRTKPTLPAQECRSQWLRGRAASDISRSYSKQRQDGAIRSKRLSPSGPPQKF